MSIEHVNIVDPNIHEPKGIVSAGSNTVYTANGASSGAWGKIKTPMLQGLSGDGGLSGLHVSTDGANGFTLTQQIAYGSMVITNNAVAGALVAVADTTFNTPSQYTLMTGASYPWSSENLNTFTFNTDRLIAGIGGTYLLIAYTNIGAFPGGTSKLSLRFRINGVTFSLRKPTVRAAGVGDENQIMGSGLLNLNANDFIQLYIASDTTGNVTIKDANLALHRVS